MSEQQPELFPAPPEPTGRPHTPNRRTSGGITVTVKRACNGCGHTLGDATDAEIEACIAGLPMPDVRDQCPTCTPA